MNLPPPESLDSTERVRALLDDIRGGERLDIERARQVYCNRDLNLEKIEAVGFDMDYTLARYRQEALDSLSVNLTLERLITERGYPDGIGTIEPRADFAIRGLVIDTWRGNVLKFDAHRHVGQGYHGFKELDAEARHQYRNESIRLNDNSRFWLIDTLFGLPEAFLYAALVDYFEREQPDREHDWKRLYGDIRYCIDLAHRDGSIKSAIMADTAAYIEGSDEELALTLHKFRSAGKKLFVVTNSFPVYSAHVMSHLLDGVLREYPHWSNYFDVMIAGASKPSFFTDRAPFLVSDPQGRIHGEEYNSFERGVIYQGGNLLDFERMADCKGESVVYIGDHIYGDIVRSKKSSAWRTVMIVQEMEAELQKAGQLRDDMTRLDEVDQQLFRLSQQITFEQNLIYQLDELSEEIDEGDRALVEKARKEILRSRDDIRRRRKELLGSMEAAEKKLEEHFNPFWGLVFRLANENTLFGEQVEDYACLYTSRVSNLLSYSPLHYFRAPRQLMPHERY